MAAVLWTAGMGIAGASEYFVAPAGNDSGRGDSGAPFSTIQHAVDAAQPGDTVTVGDGRYNEAVRILKSGTRDKPITIRSQNKWGAKLLTNTTPGTCFHIGSQEHVGVSHIMIKDFDVSAPGKWGCGVASTWGAHHIVVEGVYAHHCGASGIQLNDGDYRTARNCVCAYNALLMPTCGSGISFYGQIKADDGPGPHNIISGNVCYGNDNGPATLETDGNGIIVDDLRDIQRVYHTGKPPADLAYTGAETVVEGNLAFHNGGKGINIYSSNNVTVVNNTCFENMRRANQNRYGEFTIQCAAHVTLENNISITSTLPVDNADHARNKAYLFTAKNGTEYRLDQSMRNAVTARNNLSWDAAQPGAASWGCEAVDVRFSTDDKNQPGVDPQLLQPDAPELSGPRVPPTTTFSAYFGLKDGSPAIGAAVKLPGTVNFQTGSDLGAFPHQPSQ
jgi:parallel beta-helix repeat protein